MYMYNVFFTVALVKVIKSYLVEIRTLEKGEQGKIRQSSEDKHRAKVLREQWEEHAKGTRNRKEMFHVFVGLVGDDLPSIEMACQDEELMNESPDEEETPAQPLTGVSTTSDSPEEINAESIDDWFDIGSGADILDSVSSYESSTLDMALSASETFFSESETPLSEVRCSANSLALATIPEGEEGEELESHTDTEQG